MKKKKEKEDFVKISECSADTWSKIPIPEGAICMELEVDYSSCYYENDSPSYIIHFFKRSE